MSSSSWPAAGEGPCEEIERNLQVIGDAVNQLPEAITGAYLEIAWSQIREFPRHQPIS